MMAPATYTVWMEATDKRTGWKILESHPRKTGAQALAYVGRIAANARLIVTLLTVTRDTQVAS